MIPGRRREIILRLHRRRTHRWAVLLLPCLLLRSLIPVGFMPIFGPGLSVSLMLCPAYAPSSTTGTDSASHDLKAAAAAAPSMDMSMDMDMPMRGDAPAQSTQSGASPRSGSIPDHQDHSSCPYAASAMLAGLPAVFAVAIAEQSITGLALPLPQITYFPPVARSQSARAPPVPI
jgi:hypothetical protein